LQIWLALARVFSVAVAGEHSPVLGIVCGRILLSFLAAWFVHGYVNFAAACRSTVMDVHKKLVQGQEKYF